jgi:hypothetical protein
MARTSHNEDYYTLSPQEKITLHLHHHFDNEIYDKMSGFIGDRPIY